MGTERFTRLLIDIFSHTFTPQNGSYEGKQEDYEPDTNLSTGFLSVTVKISFKGSQWSLCKKGLLYLSHIHFLEFLSVHNNLIYV